MKQPALNMIERQALDFRQQTGLSNTEAVNLTSLLLKLNVLTIFSPLSDNFSGMSLKSNTNGSRFMLVNSNHALCCQNFTIAHELYHLFIENNPAPHKCSANDSKNSREKCADAFAAIFLMPSAGILQMIPDTELATGSITLATVIRLENYFAVPRTTVLNRLHDLSLISKAMREHLSLQPVIKTAREHGYNASLYNPGNENLVIGDFGERAKRLFDSGKVSEGHYLELLAKIGIDGYED